MKETLKKVFDKSVLAVVGVLILFVLLFEYIIFPGLTAADTYINVLSFIIGVISILFIYHYVQWGDLIDFIVGKKEVVPHGETELDYPPKEEVVKKKRVYKKKKPTKKKVTTDEEIKPKSKPKVLGEHQIKNGKPKVKSKKE
jgi:hypothetical protein